MREPHTYIMWGEGSRDIVESKAVDYEDLSPTLSEAAIDSDRTALTEVLESSLARLAQDLDRAERLWTEHIIQMAPQTVPAALWEVESMYRAIQRLREVVEARAASGAWRESVGKGDWAGPDGAFWGFSQPRSRSTEDPEGLRADLIEAARKEADTEALDLIGQAFPVKRGFLLTPLDQLAARSKAYKAVIREYVDWRDSGKPHLTKIDQTRK